MVGMTTAAHRVTTAAALTSLALAGLAWTAARPHAAAAAASGPDRTAPAQARLVDRVPAPALHWRTCRKIAQFACPALAARQERPLCL